MAQLIQTESHLPPDSSVWVEPLAGGPGYRRPALIIQSDPFNRSRIATVLAAAIAANLELGRAPGNVALALSPAPNSAKSKLVSA